MSNIRPERILLVTRNMPPLLGGMERLNWNMAKELARHADVKVVGPSGAATLAPKGVSVVEVGASSLLRFVIGASWHALKEARRFQPSIVLAGSGLTAPHALLAAKFCGAAPVAYVHGLDIVVEDRLYRSLWLPAIRRMRRVVANSHATAELCRAAKIEPDRIGIVHPGVKQSISRSNGNLEADFRVKYGLRNRPVLISVGRLTARKGLCEFVSDVLPQIVSAIPEVMLLVIGGLPQNALRAEAQSPDMILAAAEAAGVGHNVSVLGAISDDELEGAWGAAHVHVFPVRHIPGDPEGFGMVAIESAAEGVPTVAYAVGGVLDAVANGVSGYVVEEGDHGAFAASVLALLNEPLPSARVRGFASRFTWDSFGTSIMNQLSFAAK